MNTTPTPDSIRPFTHRLAAPLIAVVFAFGMAAGAVAQDKPATPTASAGLTSLITATPEEGFALAVKLSQKGVGTVQKDVDVRKALRPAYSHDPNSLIAVSHVIATHFQTVAAASNYWRK